MFFVCLFDLKVLLSVATVAFNGGLQTWVVPAGVTSLLVHAYGASGATCTDSSCAAGGLGGHIAATVTVTPLSTMYINIGGIGGTTSSSMGGFNGGGSCTYTAVQPRIAGGGGATSIRNSTAITTALVVAGTAVSC